MKDKGNRSKFGLGLIVGTVIGALTAFFLSPKSGEENREFVANLVRQLKRDLDKMELDKKVKEIYGEVSVEGEKLLSKARKELAKRMDELQSSWDKLDKEKYVNMVKDAVDSLKSQTKDSGEVLNKIKNSLVKDWEKLTVANKKTSSKK